MSFLLDTNVISETRKRLPDQRVISWIERVDQKDLFLSVLTLGELMKGVHKRRKTDPQAAASLDHWVRGIESLFSDHVIPIDAEIAAVWGHLNADQPFPVIDSLLAATAKVRSFVFVTRNIKDIARANIKTLNPWTYNPH